MSKTLSGNVNVHALETAQKVTCSFCGTKFGAGDNGVVMYGTHQNGQPVVACNECAQRVALGIVNVFTGSAWGIPLSKEGRALMEAQQAFADAASTLFDESADKDAWIRRKDARASDLMSEASHVKANIYDVLHRAHAEWRDASQKFLATVGGSTPA